jgi:Immunity protein 26
MKKQKWTNGAIVKIPLKNKTYGYGQLLDKGTILIYNIRTPEDLSTPKVVDLKKLFIVAIYNSVIPSGRWVKIGKEDIKKQYEVLPFQYIQDALNLSLFEIYDPNDGSIKKATKSQCRNLECCAVWEAEHVESRINDYFDEIPNVFFKQLKIK